MNKTYLNRALGTIKGYIDASKMNYLNYKEAVDADTLKTTGIYSLPLGCSNIPTSSSGTIIIDFNIDIPYQIWIPDGENCIYKRNWDNMDTEWESWSSDLECNITGNANSADRINNSLVITLNNGNTENKDQFLFDGSDSKTINITPDAIGSYTKDEVDAILMGDGDRAIQGQIDDINEALEGLEEYISEVENTTTNLKESMTYHTHSYAGSDSAGGSAISANKVNSTLSIQLNGGDTEDSNQFTFDGSTTKTINITPDAIGSYSKKEIDNMLLGDSDGDGDGEKAIQGQIDDINEALEGLEEYISEVENTTTDLKESMTSHTHKYAGSSSEGGSATSAEKVNKELIIKLNNGIDEGTNQFTFDGSTTKTINITPDIIGSCDKSTIEAINKDIEKLESEASSLHSSVSNLDTVTTNLNNSVSDLDELVTDLQETTTNLNNSVSNLETSNNSLQETTTNLSSSITQLQESMTSHTHKYAGSSSVGGSATSAEKVNKELIIHLNSGMNEGTNQFTFNGSDSKNINITPASIGVYSKDDIDNKLSGDSEEAIQGQIDDIIETMDGIQQNVESLGEINSDLSESINELQESMTSHTHNYAGSSSAGGAANSADKLTTARKIGNASFNGTADITLTQMGIPIIEVLSQAEYDVLEQNGTVDPNTYYLISDEL